MEEASRLLLWPRGLAPRDLWLILFVSGVVLPMLGVAFAAAVYHFCPANRRRKLRKARRMRVRRRLRHLESEDARLREQFGES